MLISISDFKRQQITQKFGRFGLVQENRHININIVLLALLQMKNLFPITFQCFTTIKIDN